MKKIKSINELNEENINFIFSKMTNNYQKNMKILEKYLGDILYDKNDNNETLLHIFAKKHYLLSKPELFLALLKLGVYPNELNNNNENFLEVLLQNYKFSFVYSIILYIFSTSPRFNFNHQNNNGETIVHSLIDIVQKWCNINEVINTEQYELQYIFNTIDRIFSNGFNITLKDNKGRDIYTMLKELPPSKQTDYYLKLIEEILNYNEDKNNFSNLEYISKFGKLISKSNEIKWVKRDIEMLPLRQAFNKNIIVITGKDGSGRVTSIERLIGELDSSFNNLKKYDYLKTSISNIINNCNSIGSFKYDFLRLLKKCADNNICLVIEDFDDMNNLNLTYDDIEDINLFIELYIEKKKFKLICTSRVNKNKLIFNNDLNSKIDEVEIKEPNDEQLIEIIDLKDIFIVDEFDMENIFKKLMLLISKEKNIIDNSISRVQVVNESINYLLNKIEKSSALFTLETIKESIINNKYITDEIKKEVSEIFKNKDININLDSYEESTEKINKRLKLTKENN